MQKCKYKTVEFSLLQYTLWWYCVPGGGGGEGHSHIEVADMCGHDPQSRGLLVTD